MSWQQLHKYVGAAQEIGFNRVCIIKRGSYRTLASSGNNHIATAWKDWDNREQINENEELLVEWKINKKKDFRFFGIHYEQIKINELITEKDKDDMNKIVSWYMRVTTSNMNIKIEGVTEIICQFALTLHAVPDKESICGIKSKDGGHNFHRETDNGDRDVICAYQFKTIWFVAAIDIDNPYKNDNKSNQKSSNAKPLYDRKIDSANDAFKAIYSEIFQPLFKKDCELFLPKTLFFMF